MIIDRIFFQRKPETNEEERLSFSFVFKCDMAGYIPQNLYKCFKTTFFSFFLLNFGPHPVVLTFYYWLCAQR